MATYTTESLYAGAESSLNPTYYSAPISYNPSVGELSMPLDPRTANQLGILNNSTLNTGVKSVEIQGLQGETWESVPEQHLDEIKRSLKLAGANASLHGPLVEASGIGERGWTEENRVGAEKQLQSAVLRSHKLDPDGNVSVTVHTTHQLPELTPHIKEEGEKIEQGLWVVNEETGQFDMIRPEKRYFEEGEEFTGEEIKFKAEKELARRNREMWTENLSQINRFAEYGEDVLERTKHQIMSAGGRIETKEQEQERKKQAEAVIEDVKKGMAGKLDLEKLKERGEDYKEFVETTERGLTHGQIYLKDAYRSMKMLFDRTYKNASDKDKAKLKKFAEEITPQIKIGIETDPAQLEKLRGIVDRGLRVLNDMKQTPEMWKKMDKFVIDKSAETFANVAESAYDKFGKTAPIINIENPPAGSGLSTGEDLKRMVEASREQLAENLHKNKGLSKSQAKDVASKMIGATWDVGHINMLRKKGYTEKDIIEQTKIVAPFVKHVHLSDNFGMDHTELPMGMGNVPLKGMMDELKKKGFKGQKVVEAGNWWQHFAEHGGGNPFKQSIELVDSPIYAMKEGPGWADATRYGTYYMGHGPVNPSVHHNLYGAGFQNLPVELGGEIPGDRGRFAGTPNQ